MRGLVGLGWLMVSGCTIGTAGEEGGVFQFYQPTAYPGDALGDRDVGDPVALGARLDVALLGWDEATDGVPTWSIEDGEALIVEEEGLVLAVRAVAEGEARVRATAADGSTDVVTLVVEPLGSSELVVDDGFLWGGDVAPSSLTELGRSLRPGAQITVGANLFSDSGARMSGYDLLDWTVDAALVTSDVPADLVNAITLGGLGVAGEVGIGVDGGGALALGLQDGTEVNALQVYAPEVGEDETVFPIDEISGEEGLILIGLAALDVDGRFVIAGPGDNLIVSATPAAVLRSVTSDPSLDGLSLVMCRGEGEIEFQFVGGVITVPFAISANPDVPAECGG